MTVGLVAVLVAASGTALALRWWPGSGGDPSGPPPAAGPAAGPRNKRTTEPAPTGSPGMSTSGGGGPECRYQPAPGEVTAPRPPGRAALSGTVHVTLRTNRGAIALDLDGAKAPCTVNSFASLARSDYYTDSPCHRLTTTMIFVLQCGDPTATGAGTPGYRFDDENLPVGKVPAYPRGTVAMANAGPDTNGSQFFIVYRDSDIDPNYPLFGRVTDGLGIVEEVADSGAPNNDGAPNLELIIERIEIA
jgi:peptidyl-prolyl cis-trans isomerase B (cyclophilin B)